MINPDSEKAKKKRKTSTSSKGRIITLSKKLQSSSSDEISRFRKSKPSQSKMAFFKEFEGLAKRWEKNTVTQEEDTTVTQNKDTTVTQGNESNQTIAPILVHDARKEDVNGLTNSNEAM